MRVAIAVLVSVCALLVARGARADRLAVLALPSADAPAPVVQADALSSHLIQNKHRTINSSDVRARVQAGNHGADAAWAAARSQSIAQARAALTRLDRQTASSIARQVDDSIRRAGGGAGGPEMLVEWALLERSLSLSSSGVHGAARWMQVAAAIGPRVVLDPLRFPEEDRNAFAAAVAEAEKLPPATVAMTSAPSSAELWVDGVLRCVTPCSAQLVPGHHFARVVSPAHAPSVLELELPAGSTNSREVGLSAAYSGASLDAIAAMLADPSRSAEASSALLSVARFLDVDHIIALSAERDGKLRMILVPPSTPLVRSGLSGSELDGAADNALSSERAVQSGDGPRAHSSWYAQPMFWITMGAAVVAASAGAIYWGTRSDEPQAQTGTLVVGGR